MSPGISESKGLHNARNRRSVDSGILLRDDGDIYFVCLVFLVSLVFLVYLVSLVCLVCLRSIPAYQNISGKHISISENQNAEAAKI